MVEHAAATETRDVHAEKIINAIKSGRWEEQVKQIRRAYFKESLRSNDAKAAKLAADTLKKELPGVTWSGRFERRANDALIEHSGSLCADIDDLGSDELADVRAKLLTSPYLVGLFRSPTGRGLKAIFRVPADAQKHLGSFRAIERHVLELTGVHVDQACKDVARLCFVSCDPDCYYNPAAQEIQPLPEPEKPLAALNANREVNLSERQRIATEELDAIDWQSETSGFVVCPGKHLHTTVTGERDCEVNLDGVPTAFCFHNSCRGILEGVNYTLRSRIGKAEFVPTPRVEARLANSASFPLHCLPPACEAMARAICETVRVRESLPGCSILGISSAAIGKGLQIRSGANRVTRGNLYVLPSAESGSGKSETFRHAAKPFIEFETELVERWKEEIKPELLAEFKVLEAEIAKLTKLAGKANGSTEREEIRAELKEKLAALDKVEAKLRTPALSCEDVTGEKLAVLLAHNGEQMASLSADALSIVNILLGRYNKLDRTDEGIYLKAFTGDRCKVARQTRASSLVTRVARRGKSYKVRRRFLSASKTITRN
jgi:hypothetical protein